MPEDVEESEEEAVEAQLIGRKRARSETTAVVVPAPTATGVPLIGKTSKLRSLYKFSPGMFFLLPLLIFLSAKMHLHYSSEIKKKTPEKGVTFGEAGVKRPKITIKPTNAAAQDAARAAEVQRKAEEAKKREEEKKKMSEEKRRKDEEERKRKEEEERKKREVERKRKEEEERKKREEERRRRDEEARLAEAAKKKTLEKGPEVARPTQSGPVISKGSGRGPSSSASSGGAGGYNPNVIGAKDTIGDIYYKSYNEEERDTFQEFGPAREWFLNSFPPAEVNRQRAKPHELLYRTFILGEANARAANHQIVREWRTMVRERADWEGYRERMLKRIADFETSKVALEEERAKFEADKKAEAWGREGLQKKLHNVEEQLAKEKAEFKRICAQDNERAYAARQKIIDLEAKVAELTSKVEEVHQEKAAKQQVEVS
ncbi:putative igA-specific serine endopeptidase [Helianthus anomalus]